MTAVRLLLHCRGVVQGVGFRPAVYRLASTLELTGQIANDPGLVRLDLSGSRQALEQFVAALPAALPPQARLEPLQPQWLPQFDVPPEQLRIQADQSRSLGIGLVAPSLAADRAPCERCLRELQDPADRRYRYPFISCCDCGPRYSIATAEPYARANTTLVGFGLCADCRHEFDDPADRRFHAETIACPRCGPRLQWRDALGQPGAEGQAALAAAVALLRDGRILALQGVGGFQLLVDASCEPAVVRLRRRKARPRKPLALLAADPASVERWVHLNDTERRLLQGPEAPIVLLRRRAFAAGLAAGIAPGSGELGVMLPASPLHHLLVEAFAGPLVATSGNRSGEPLCIDFEEALVRLGPRAPTGPIADGWLVHDRPIARPLDDAVVRLVAGRPQMLRRARGYAPLPLPLPSWASPGIGRSVLALGGDLKCAPALAAGAQVWLSAPLGDLADGRCHGRWQQGLWELLLHHGDQLALVLSDQHPGYLSHHWAQQLTQGPWQHKTVHHKTVQHHRAHALAVLAEHGVAPPALVLACDGLGHGPGDVSLWGGEGLLIGSDGSCRRLACLRPFGLPGGSRALREPRRVALALLAALGPWALEHPGAVATHQAFDDEARQLLLRALAVGIHCPSTTSLGRLFDGVASLLGVVQCLSHEGEAGLLLQGAAEPAGGRSPMALLQRRASALLPLEPASAASLAQQWLDWRPLLRVLLAQRAAGVPVAISAQLFHRALIAGLAGWAQQSARRSGVNTVVLAGGCFQNRLLLEGLIEALAAVGLQPLWAQQLPCGDGALAVGQLVAAQLEAQLAAPPQ